MNIFYLMKNVLNVKDLIKKIEDLEDKNMMKSKKIQELIETKNKEIEKIKNELEMLNMKLENMDEKLYIKEQHYNELKTINNKLTINYNGIEEKINSNISKTQEIINIVEKQEDITKENFNRFIDLNNVEISTLKKNLLDRETKNKEIEKILLLLEKINLEIIKSGDIEELKRQINNNSEEKDLILKEIKSLEENLNKKIAFELKRNEEEIVEKNFKIKKMEEEIENLLKEKKQDNNNIVILKNDIVEKTNIISNLLLEKENFKNEILEINKENEKKMEIEKNKASNKIEEILLEIKLKDEQILEMQNKEIKNIEIKKLCEMQNKELEILYNIEMLINKS